MPNQSGDLGATPFRPIPLVPIYAFSFLSALFVSFSFRFEHSAHAALLAAGLLFAAIAVASFAWFLLAADEFFKAINYQAPRFWICQFYGADTCVRVSQSFWSESPSSPTIRSSGLHDCLVDRRLDSCRLLEKIE